MTWLYIQAGLLACVRMLLKSSQLPRIPVEAFPGFLICYITWIHGIINDLTFEFFANKDIDCEVTYLLTLIENYVWAIRTIRPTKGFNILLIQGVKNKLKSYWLVCKVLSPPPPRTAKTFFFEDFWRRKKILSNFLIFI